jgi:glycosyltransferase involved in cell wall biosynthesis
VKPSVIIPAYNEEHGITGVLGRTLRLFHDGIQFANAIL